MLVDAWLTCGITSALPLRSGALEPRTIHREMVGAGRRSLIGGCDQFDSEALIGGIGVPVMILHGTADSNIPITEARRLYAAAREPKTMIEVEGAGHLDA